MRERIPQTLSEALTLATTLEGWMIVTDAEGPDTYLDNALTFLLICRRSETLQM